MRGREGLATVNAVRTGLRGRALAGAVALLLTAGCTSTEEPADDGAATVPATVPTTVPASPDDGAAVVTLAKADGWRQGLDATSIPGDAGFAVLELAYDDEAATALWDAAVPTGLPAASGDPDDAGLYGALDDVDLADHVVGLWSSGQSGSCPGQLASAEADGGTVRLVEVQDLQGGNGCTDDYRPYSQVVVLNRYQVPPQDALPVDGELTFATVTNGAKQPDDGPTLRAVVTAFDG
jgi:hypothetical protein